MESLVYSSELMRLMSEYNTPICSSEMRKS
jgi:hypothetical protein